MHNLDPEIVGAISWHFGDPFRDVAALATPAFDRYSPTAMSTGAHLVGWNLLLAEAPEFDRR
jgi:hypothetical protein